MLIMFATSAKRYAVIYEINVCYFKISFLKQNIGLIYSVWSRKAGKIVVYRIII